MILETKVVGSFDTFSYIIGCPVKKEAAIIDPAGNEQKILWIIKENDLTLKYILLTHAHPDHTAGIHKIKRATNALVCVHKEEENLINNVEFRSLLKIWGFNDYDFEIDIYLQDNDIISIGELDLVVIHTPGHSPGSVCYYLKSDNSEYGHLFSGDTVFVGAVGNSDLPGGSFEQLVNSIKTKILALPDKTIIHPGHDYGDTQTSTIEREKRENPFFSEYFLSS